MYKEGDDISKQKISVEVSTVEEKSTHEASMLDLLSSFHDIPFIEPVVITYEDLHKCSGEVFLKKAYLYSQNNTMNEDQIIKGTLFFVGARLPVDILLFWIDNFLSLPGFNFQEDGIVETILDDWENKPAEEKRRIALHVLDHVDLNRTLLFAIPWFEILEMTEKEGVHLICSLMKEVKEHDSRMFEELRTLQEELEFIEMLDDYDDKGKDVDIGSLYYG